MAMSCGYNEFYVHVLDVNACCFHIWFLDVSGFQFVSSASLCSEFFVPKWWASFLHRFKCDQAYLNAFGMEEVEKLLRRRSVGMWFLDHFDNPLDANLPLFPPNIEAGFSKGFEQPWRVWKGPVGQRKEELTFKVGVERPAVTFTVQAGRKLLWQ